jgi:hypothetical protein
VGPLEGRRVTWTLARVAAASAVGGGLAYGLVRVTDALAGVPGGFLAQLAIAGAAGLAACYGLAAAFGVAEARDGLRAVRGLPARLARRRR